MSNPLADYRALQAASAYLHPFKGRTLDLSRRVRVYRNLHARAPEDRYSILQGGLVVAHAPYVLLTDVRFVVLPAAWRRSLKLGHKVVCAFAEGKVAASAMGITAASDRDLPVPVRFDKTAGKFIITANADEVVAARAALLSARGLSVSYATIQI